MSIAIHVSIVSHGQAELASRLLEDLARWGAPDLTITVLSNVPEPAPLIPPTLASRTERLVNEARSGFGANHNQVFRRCSAPYFCVLNPDVRLRSDPFPALLQALADPAVAVAAPAAVDPQGRIQDNARRLPSPLGIAGKLFSAPAGPDYPRAGGTVSVDWVAGFFMLFRAEAFRRMGGFDERYFLYYEDIDLCTRLRLAGQRIAWLPQVTVVHDARRRSHRSPRYLMWHLRSIARFFGSPVYRSARELADAQRL